MRREARFMLRDRAVIVAVALALLLSSVAVVSGVLEVRDQRRIIDDLIVTDAEDREAALSAQSDWGSAAYYAFFLTYDSPAPFAFAALGQRDSAAWKHRVRALAIEGQIYERDAGNPVFALIGRFDFAFFATFVLPLLLIALLHDLRASERAVGRHDLLVATAAEPKAFWFTRATVRSIALYAAIVIPLILAGVLSGSGFVTLLIASAMLALYVLFWMLVCLRISAWRQSAGAILSTLLGVWLLLAVVVPAAGRMTIDRLIELPQGSDILLTQREAVNDAWDLPKETTMDAFVKGHPEWEAYSKIEQPFEWKWYFAFQQVGDEQALPLADAYREGRQRRDRWASLIALITPPALMERSLQKLAETDITASIAYEREVRQFHETLRKFYYSKMFNDEELNEAALNGLPRFSPTN